MRKKGKERIKAALCAGMAFLMLFLAACSGGDDAAPVAQQPPPEEVAPETVVEYIEPAQTPGEQMAEESAAPAQTPEETLTPIQVPDPEDWLPAETIKPEISPEALEPSTGTPGFPEHFETGVDTKRVNFVVDASVEVPDKGKFPVERVTLAPLSQENADRAKQYFFGSAEMTDISLLYTQPQIQAEITKLEGELQKSYQAGYDKIEPLEDMIEELKERLKTAPYEADPTKKPRLRTEYENGRKTEIIDSSANIGGKEPSTFYVYNSYGDSGCLDSSMLVCKLFEFYYYDPGNKNRAAKPNGSLALTGEAAIDVAKRAARFLGVTDVEVDKAFIGVDENTGKQGYYVKLRRAVDGVAVKPTSISNGGGQAEPETMIITMDDFRVTSFSWTNKFDTLGYAMDNVELLPFDEIAAVLEEQVKNKFAWENDGEYLFEGNGEAEGQKTLRIDRIALEYACIPEADSENTYLLTPVWNFYEDEPYSEYSDYLMPSTGEPICHLSINAVDGSVV